MTLWHKFKIVQVNICPYIIIGKCFYSHQHLMVPQPLKYSLEVPSFFELGAKAYIRRNSLATK